MAWTAPMTAVSGAVFTADQYNTHVRDNLYETGVAKVSGDNQIFVATGTNRVVVREPTAHTVATAESLESTPYVDLATPGPTVTVETGTRAFVYIACNMGHRDDFDWTGMGYDISGATTSAASNDRSIAQDGLTGGATALVNDMRFGAVFLEDALTEGTNTFTAKYQAAGGTGDFSLREMIVWPL